MGYIFVYLPTDEDTLLPRGVSWNEEDSVNAYSRQVEQALLDRWPGVEVDVTAYAQRLLVETDVPDADEEVIRAIVEAVWSRFDWLSTAPDETGRMGFHVTDRGDLVGDVDGYSTLYDAVLTAQENADAAEIWLGGDVVARTPRT